MSSVFLTERSGKRASRLPITDPAEDIFEKEGDGWHREEHILLSEYPLLQMRQFSHTNHCSLTALTSVFCCFRRQGFTRLPADPQEVFSVVHDLARAHLIYTPVFGTYPWRMAELARRSWHHFGYPGKACTTFVLSPRDALQDLFLEELRAYRPGLISFTFAPYRRHTVTFYGAEVWSKGNQRRVYLRINTHWSVVPQYVDVDTLGTWRGSYAALCLLRA